MLTETMNEPKARTRGPVWICKREGDPFGYETVCDRCSHRDQDLQDRWVCVRPVRAGDQCERCLKPIGGGA